MKRLTLTVFILFLIATSIFALQLTEGFENDFPPRDWENNIVTGHAWIQGTSANTGSYSAQFMGTINRGSEGVLLTPRLDLTVSEADELSFWYKAPIWSSDQNELYVEISTDGAENWIEIAHLLNAEDFESHTYNLETYTQTNTTYIRFRAIDDYGYPTLLDDVVASEIYIDPLAPGYIENISPENESANQSVTPTITWDFGVNTETYDLYLDTVNPPLIQVVTDGVASIGAYTPSGIINDDTTYYWKVVCKNSVRDDTINPVYSFTTKDWLPADIFGLSPEDGALSESIGTSISWSFGENAESYDLYYDTVYPPVNQVVTDGICSGTGNYNPGRLAYDTTYYWKVVSKNSNTVRTTENSFSFTTALSPDMVGIGTGTITDKGLPVDPFFGYSYSQSIYLQSEIDFANQRIEKIWYYYNGSSDLDNTSEWVIYMGHTSLTEFATNTDWISIDNLLQVASVTLDPYPTEEGWIEFALDTPFVYNNVDNLVIAVEDNQSGYETSSDEFYCSSVTGSRSIMYRNDNTNPDPVAPPVAAGIYNYIPNIRMKFGELPEQPEFFINPDSYDFGITYINTSSDAPTFTISNNGGADLIINDPIAMENGANFNVTDNNSYPITIAPTDNVTFEVTFSPSSVGVFNDNIVIVDNITRLTHSIPVQGEGFDPVISSYPYDEDFENGGELTVPWEQGTEDDSDWTISDSTPSSSTGPTSGDHTSGDGLFIFTEATSHPNERFDLLTPVFNIESLTNPTFSFYYNMYGSTMGELHFDIWDGTAWNEDVAPAISGNQGTGWFLHSFLLSGYGDEVRVRFRAITGSDYNSDICLDDVHVFDNTNPPATSTLVSPSDAAIEQPFEITLEWDTVAFADGYYLNLGTDNPPTNILNMQDNGINLTYNATNLNGGTTYYWQVVPYNANGNTNECPVWSFTTYGNAPEEITMTTPTDAATNVDGYTTFRWNSDSWADGYYLYVSLDNENFTQTDVGDITGVTLTSPLDYETTYYWYVTGYNPNGESPAPTNTFSFTTQSDPNYGGDGVLYGGYYFANSTAGGNGLGYQPSFGWVDISETGTSPSYTSADDGYATVDIGFTFNYFGNDYTQIYLGTNGYVMFSNPATSTGSNMTIPNASTPNDVIAISAMDMHTTDIPSNCYYGNDANGNFVYTVEMWNDYDDYDEYMDMQVILYPNGRIKVQYRNYVNLYDDTGSLSIPGDACIGIENADGTVGIQYRNNGEGGPMLENMAIAYSSSLEGLAEPAGLITTPENVSISYDGSVMNLTWDAVSGATLYKVYAEETPEFEANELTYLSSWSTNSASMDVSLFTGSHYFVKVTATDEEVPAPIGAPSSRLSQKTNLRNLSWMEYKEPKLEENLKKEK